jgi:hypothetical protein
MWDQAERVCPRCGEAAADHRFCPSCGLQIEALSEEPTRPERESGDADVAVAEHAPDVLRSRDVTASNGAVDDGMAAESLTAAATVAAMNATRARTWPEPRHPVAEEVGGQRQEPESAEIAQSNGHDPLLADHNGSAATVADGSPVQTSTWPEADVASSGFAERVPEEIAADGFAGPVAESDPVEPRAEPEVAAVETDDELGEELRSDAIAESNRFAEHKPVAEVVPEEIPEPAPASEEPATGPVGPFLSDHVLAESAHENAAAHTAPRYQAARPAARGGIARTSKSRRSAIPYVVAVLGLLMLLVSRRRHA